MQSCTWVVTAALWFAAGIGTASQLQEPAAPKPIDSSARPIYPAAARTARIEGDVQYRATIRSDGSVESVTILRVPPANMGFETAVEDAVKRWRFQPTPGAATATYSATMRFELSIPLEWIYPISSRTAWTHIRDLARDLKLGVERVDDKQQLLITDWQHYRGRGFSPQDGLDLPKGQLPEDIQFHVRVAPGMQPARVAIGSIIRTRHMDRRREGLTIYGRAAPSAALMARLNERTGTTPKPLAAPSRLDSSCLPASATVARREPRRCCRAATRRASV